MPSVVAVRVLDCHPSSTLVEVEADDGSVGIGLTQSPAAVIRPIIELGPGGLRNHLLGQDPRDVDRLWRAMWVGWGAQYGRGSEGGLAVNAMAALDMALWDLAGKIRGEPVWRLLGGLVQERVMAYASGSAYVSSSYEGPGPWRRKSPATLADEARTYVGQGFRAMKFGWGPDFGAEARAGLRAIREAVGPEVRLMVDIGCPGYWEPGWSAYEAGSRAGEIARIANFEIVEHPPPIVDGYLVPFDRPGLGLGGFVPAALGQLAALK